MSEKDKPRLDPDLEMRRMTRRSFMWAGVAITGGYAGIKWIATRRTEDGLAYPLRSAFEFTEQVNRDLYNPARLSPTFPRSMAGEPRPNGAEGLGESFDPSDWQLTIEGVFGKTEPVQLSLEAIKKLPRTEIVTELKCIEGWSQIVHWAGTRFADLVALYPPFTLSGEAPNIKEKPTDLADYVGMSTPDGGYYVGLDRESALHPQTLLCYEMNGEPLTLEHGAPLRLVIPVKYGIKNIKRIGTIQYTTRRPADYWAERGYDWYAGL
jgi:hypothetical protein